MRKTRAALLPYPGDPFLLNYWLRLYEKFWKPEIDTLYVYLNSPIEPEVREYIEDRVLRAGKTVFLAADNQMEHGAVIYDGLRHIDEEITMLVEDDGFIFQMGAVDQCFNMIESGAFDLVGSKRGSCGLEIYNAAMAHWGLKGAGEGDQGPNFWPCYLFCRTETLLKVDNFGAKAWKRGEVVPYINHEMIAEIEASDTMVEASMQLRSMIPEGRISYVPQYHAHPDDLDHYRDRKYLFDGRAPWCHIGSLSSGVGGILKDDQNRSLARRKIDPPNGPTVLGNEPKTDFERREFERRVQWWLTFWESREWQKIDDFADAYKKAIDQIIAQYQLAIGAIRARQNAYKEIGL